MASLDAAIAIHRFGLGARIGEIDNVGDDARAWLQAQLTELSSELTGYNLPSTKANISLYYQYLEAQRQEMAAAAPADFAGFVHETRRREALTRPPGGREAENARIAASKADTSGTAATASDLYQQMVFAYANEVSARTRHASLTPGSFRERLVRFWSDHFTVSINKQILIPTGAALEREAIRPHVTGRFEDMLLAVESHPAMLAYLDNWYSIGPNSYAGSTFDLGLNENLAREILELHTLGVDGGYSQGDVTEFAKAITGWSIGNPQIQPERLGEFIFEPIFHEPGSRTILGQSYPSGGVGQGQDILVNLARHPATARHIARKLCAHFISDTPPEAAVVDLEAVYNATGGDLEAVYTALIARPEMWDGALTKMRSAEEFVIAAIRALDRPDFDFNFLFATLQELGQQPFFAPSPAGWPDDVISWSSPNEIRGRLDWSVLYTASFSGETAPADLGTDIMAGLMSDYTRTWLGNASNPQQGAALMLMSPEFQRR